MLRRCSSCYYLEYLYRYHLQKIYGLQCICLKSYDYPKVHLTGVGELNRIVDQVIHNLGDARWVANETRLQVIINTEDQIDTF